MDHCLTCKQVYRCFQTGQHFNQSKLVIWAFFKLFELHVNSCVGTVSDSLTL